MMMMMMMMGVVMGEPLTTRIHLMQIFPATLLQSMSEKQSEIRVTIRGGGGGGGGGGEGRRSERRMLVVVSAKGRGGNNRKPLQRGRDLSIEAIQTVQALKRAFAVSNSPRNLDHVLHSKFSRLLKFDMIAVLRELLRQNHCLLALKVFEVIRMEVWYKPQVSLYVDMATVLASNGLLEHVQLLLTYLKAEINLEPDAEGFSALLRTLMSFNLNTSIVVECYDMTKALGCEPDRPTFKILINGLELMGQSDAAAIMRQDAQKYYGEYVDFLQEEDEISTAKT